MTQTLSRAARAQLTLDAVDAVDLIGRGEWTTSDALALLGDDFHAGLVQYVGLLEAMLVTMRGVDVAEVRAACRDTCRRLIDPA